MKPRKLQPKNEASTAAAEPSRRYRRAKWLCGGLVVVALLVLFLPAILVNTPLKQLAIDSALSDLKGSASVSRISAGWFSPVQLDDVVLLDEAGREILTVESIRTSLSLSGLIFASDYGTVEVIRPSVDLIVRESGSNIEDALAAYLVPSEKEQATKLPRVSLVVTGGLVRVQAESIGETHILENIECTAQTMAETAPVSVKLTCTAKSGSATADNAPGQLAVGLKMDAGQTEFVGQTLAADVQTNQFPVSVLAPVLTRIIGPTNCGGQLESRFNAAVNLQSTSMEVDVENFQASQFGLVCPAWLGADQFSANRLTATGALTLSPSLITARQFKVESEFMRFITDGTFDVNELVKIGSGGDLPQSGFQLDGTVDVAQIATMLPETTRLREKVLLNSGVIQVQAGTRVENGASRLIVNADAANMNFVVNGQSIQWQHPVRFVCVAGQQDGWMRLESLELRSDFLAVTGDASVHRGRVRIEADLDKALRQIGQVLDLGGLQLAGAMQGDLNWSAVNAEQALPSDAAAEFPINIDGNFTFTNPEFKYPGYRTWKHRNMAVSLASNAIVNRLGNLAINSATMDATIGEEKMAAVLNGRIDDLWRSDKFEFKCDASGSIAKWLEHARVFSEFPEFVADGAMTGQFDLHKLNGESCRLNELSLNATDFSLDGFSMNVREPSLTGKMNIKYVYADGSLEFGNATITSTSIAASTEQLKLLTGEKLLVDGDVAFRANANRASNWFGLSMPGDSVRWDGSAVGQMKFSSESGLFGGIAIAEITDLVVVQPEAQTAANRGNMQSASHGQSFVEVWREPKITVTSDIQLTDDFNNLRLRSLDLKSKLANVEAKGSINELAQSVLADLNGRWDIKWENVNQMIRELAGDVVYFEGSGWQPFEIKGPLCDAGTSAGASPWISSALAGTVSIGWNKASVYKLPLGQSQIDIGVTQSAARLTSPPNTPPNNRNMVDQLLTLQPVLDLRQSDPLLRMGQGKLLDQWRITSDDSRTWLKYAAPLVADATSAEGLVSVSLEGANVNLFDPMNASAKGTIEVHELTVGAGPLAQQLLPMLDQVRAILKPASSSLQEKSTWLQLKPQSLPVMVDQGRVHHDGFEMSYKEFAIRTRGSVGFDQSLNMVADVPILDEWISKDRMLAGLKGKSISIPITGTLSKPRLDSSVVSQMTAQLLRDSAKAAIDEKVSQEVGKLQQKVGDSVQDEVGKLKNKVNDKIQNGVQDRLQGELRNGLKNLFGEDRKK